MIAALLLCVGMFLPGQGSDTALRDRVARLTEKLDSGKKEARDLAEKTLIELGPKALGFLPEPSPSDSKDRAERLERIRKTLRAAAEAINLDASKVTIRVRGVRLSEALKALRKASGNIVTDLRDEPTNPTFDLDFKEKPFLEALDEVAEKAGVGLEFYTGDGTIGLINAGEMEGKAAASEPKPLKSVPFRAYPGPFRVTLKRISAARDFETGQNIMIAQLAVDWEPRLRPMLLALKAEDVKATDDRGKSIAANVDAESASTGLKAENPSAEVNLNFDVPDREAKRIASLKVKATVTVPAALRTFRFPRLTKKNVVVTRDDMSVTLESAEADEQIWKVAVSVSLPKAGPAFESYQQGMFNSRIWLQRADGSRFEQNGGMNQTSGEDGKLGFEYLFVDAPGKLADYQLFYEAPAKIVTIPLEFEFKDVPLP